MIDNGESRRIIKQAMLDDKLVVFVGAGASVNSGIPLWGDAVRKMREHLGKTSLSENEYLKVPQYYFNARGEKEYVELMRSIFNFDDKKLNEVHKLIVELAPNSVITTNYDDFIERAFWERGEFLEVVERDSDIPYAKSNRLIIKMHGGFTHNNFVLKEDDYINYSSNFPLIETYVKALMAKNVVFFIGYSYSDPDVKQLMNWVKQILGKDHQRAYLLDTSGNFDLNNVEYYKNLGVNIIYASECLGDSFADDRYQNTIEFLKYIIRDEDEVDAINAVYNELSPLNEFNHILDKYVMSAINKHLNKSVVQTTHIYSDIQVYDESLIDMFRKFNDPAYMVKGKLATIASVFEKTIFTKVVAHTKTDEEMFHSQDLVYTFPNVEEDDFFEAVALQDIVELNQLVNAHNPYDDASDNQATLRVAFAYYELDMYEKCHSLLKMLSSKFLAEKNYVWYFICEYNRYHIGRSWYSSEATQNEVKKIDLEKILSKTPKESQRSRILKELMDFSLFYVTLIDTDKKRGKVEKDTRTNFVSGSGVPTISELERKMYDLYCYITKNFLMVDNYIEVLDVFRNFIGTVFLSHSKKEVIYNDSLLGFGHGKNVVLKELSPFTVTIILKYSTKTQMDELVSEHDIKEIKLADGAEDVLFDVIKNYERAFEARITSQRINMDRMQIALTLLSRIKISKERFIETLTIVNNLTYKDYFLFCDWKAISSFIYYQHKNNSECLDDKALHSFVSTLCEKIGGDKIKDDWWHLKTLLNNCCFILSELNNNLLADDSSIEAIITRSRYALLKPIYPVASSKMKEAIANAILEYIEQSEKFPFEIYHDAAVAKIIHTSKELEKRMLEEIASATDKDKERHIELCAFLHLNGKLIEIQNFVALFKDGNDKVRFLYDMDGFDYGKFNFEWLRSFNSSLKQRISENQTAYGKIKNMYRYILQNEEYDKHILEDYLEYFDKEPKNIPDSSKCEIERVE